MASAEEGEAGEQEVRRSEFNSGNWDVPVYFALLSPRTGVHAELLELLQAKIVAPLIERRILCEFRVLTTTPPSFLVAAATLIVFELTVPCPWPITDWDVRQWRRRLGSGVHLVVAPSTVPRREVNWDSCRARSALARAMVLPPAKKGLPPPPRKKSGCTWISKSQDRSSFVLPTLSAIEETSGSRVRLALGATLLNPSMAAEVAQHLPVSLRFRTAWRLAYSPRLHGVSLKTLYRRIESEGPSLLLVQDHLGCAFGGFATAPWHAADRYFGSGECFVFRFRRRFPKPVLPLQAQLLAQQAKEQQARGGPQPAIDDEDAARDMIKQAVKVLSEWHPKVRAEAERACREAKASGRVTSLTEALDEVLSQYNDLAPTPAAATARMPEEQAPPSPISAELHEAADEPASPDEAAGSCLEQEEEPVSRWESEDGQGDLGLETFHWALKDPFFMFSDLECIAMGGGSSFALYLEKDLLHGISEPCSTFSSEKLSSEENFIISNLECWVFDDPSEVEGSQ